MSEKIPCYLKTYRKHMGFSQSEISVLLGFDCRTNLSKFERNERTPSLLNALILENIYNTPVNELFPFLNEIARSKLLSNVGSLNELLKQQENEYKLNALEGLLMRLQS